MSVGLNAIDLKPIEWIFIRFLSINGVFDGYEEG